MSEIKQQILIVSRNLPPIVGGIERLMHRLISGFSLERHCTVVGPRGCKAQLPASVRVVELPHRPAIVFVLLAWVVVNFLCLRERFTAIVAGNGLMRLTAATLMRRCPVVTMVYGLDIIAPHWLYQRLCLPLIADSAAVIACSSNSARMARERGVPADRLHVITPGVEMPVHHDLRSTAESEAEGPLLISVGRLVRRKGVAEFVRYALPLVLERHPATRLCVIGEDASAALRQDGPESERIRAAAREGGVESNVTLVGFLDENALANMLDRARVHVFPVLDMPDDVEGFGLVALEAAAHGVPTVAFDAGGVSDAVADGVSGALVLSGDYASFADRVCAAIETGRALEESCRAHAEMNSWPRFVRRLAEVMDVACGSRARGERVG